MSSISPVDGMVRNRPWLEESTCDAIARQLIPSIYAGFLRFSLENIPGVMQELREVILKICEAGESVLRQPARELATAEILSAEIQDLIGSMYETMRAAPGVGLAAPQIGLPLQLAVIEDRQEFIDKVPPEHAAERERVAVAPHVIVNPRLTLGDERVEFFEGCLSLPGFTAIVPRARAVRVECLNERAEPVIIQARGWYARILQHEIDHLRGALYIDRMLTRSFMGRENYERYWKDLPLTEFRRLIGLPSAQTD